MNPPAVKSASGCQALPARNPFATSRWAGWGKVPLWLPPGQSVSRLLARLAEHQGRGQIIGPHGSGKTTLLHHLRHHLEQHQKAECLGRRRFGPTGAALWHYRLGPGKLATATGRLWFVDGWEQLPWRWRLRLRWRLCRGEGLLITTHRPAGLPELLRTEATEELLRHVLDHLCPDYPKLLSPGETLGGILHRHRGNLREVLFEFYDRYERRLLAY